MTKRFVAGLLAGLLIGLPGLCLAQTADRVVATRGDAQVYESDMREAFDAIPGDLRQGVISNPDKVGAILDEVLLAKQIVRSSPQGREWLDGLDYRPSVQQFKDKATEIMDARAGTQNEENLEDLARETYLARPEQFKLPDRFEFSLALMPIVAKAVDPEESTESVEQANAGSSENKQEALAPDDLFELVAMAPVAGSDNAIRVEQFDFEGLSKQPRHVILAARSIRAPGQTSKVFRLSDESLAQVRLDAYEKGRQRTYDEVREIIVERLKVDLKQAAVRRHTVPLGSLPLDINGEALNTVAAAYLSQAVDG